MFGKLKMEYFGFSQYTICHRKSREQMGECNSLLIAPANFPTDLWEVIFMKLYKRERQRERERNLAKNACLKLNKLTYLLLDILIFILAILSNYCSIFTILCYVQMEIMLEFIEMSTCH